MSEDGATPTRSRLEADNPELVLTVIDGWPKSAERMTDHGDSYEAAVRAPEWEGRTAGGVITTAAHHNGVIGDHSAAITTMADIARAAMGPVISHRNRTLGLIEDAERDGQFVVDDDFTVDTDRLAQRPAADQWQVQIRQSAQNWWAAHTAAADQMYASGRGLTQSAGIQLVDHHIPLQPGGPFPRDPGHPLPDPGNMTRAQAATGLKAVNRKIAAHNEDIPKIAVLPLNDPRRTDFTIEMNLLNQEKQQYLNILPPQHPPRAVVGPDGIGLPGVPTGIISELPVNSGQGWIYPVAANQPGIDPRVVSIRVMEPTSTYPNGYVNYLNAQGQEVDPTTGRTIAPSNDYAHIPLPPS